MPAFSKASVMSLLVTEPYILPSSPNERAIFTLEPSSFLASSWAAAISWLLRAAAAFFKLFDAREVARGRRHGEPARQQEVAREARTNLHDFAAGAEILDVRLKQNMGACSHRYFAFQSLVVKGKSAIVRARLIANCTERWCFAHTPEMRRGTILPRSVTK